MFLTSTQFTAPRVQTEEQCSWESFTYLPSLVTFSVFSALHPEEGRIAQ